MEKRTSPLETNSASKKKPQVKKETKSIKDLVDKASLEAKPVAKRINPLSLDTKEKVEINEVKEPIEKIIEKTVEVIKEVPAPYTPALKVNNLNVNRKMKFFFKLSTSIINALNKVSPNTPLNVNVENAVLDGLKVSNKEVYEETIKELKGE